MNVITLPDLAAHPVVRRLAGQLSSVFQLQAIQCLLSRNPAGSFVFGPPEREIPTLARVIRFHAAGLPRMALSQLISRCRRAFRQPDFVEDVRALGLNVLGKVPVLNLANGALMERCRLALPEVRSFIAQLSLSPVPTRPERVNRSLQLRFRSMACRRDAHPEWPGEDELHLSLFLVDDHGRVSKRVVSYQGTLSAGDRWNQDQVVQVFDLVESQPHPKVFTVTLLLGEVELRTFGNVLEEVYEDLRRELIRLLVEAAGHDSDATRSLVLGREQGTGAGVVAPVDCLVSAVAGRLVADLIGWLVPVSDDHLLDARVTSVIFPDAGSWFPGTANAGAPAGPATPNALLEFVTPCGGEGEYELALELSLVAAHS